MHPGWVDRRRRYRHGRSEDPSGRYRRRRYDRVDDRRACVGCHDETAASSDLYSDRLEIDRSDGGKAYLCADCHARARAAKTGGELSDADLRTIGDNGLMIGAGLFGI